MAGHGNASRGQVAYGHRAKRDARPAGAVDRTGGLVPLVGKRHWEIAHLHEKDRFSCTAGLGSMQKDHLSFLLHACIQLEKGCMARGTPDRGRLKMHDFVAREGVKWGMGPL